MPEYNKPKIIILNFAHQCIRNACASNNLIKDYIYLLKNLETIENSNMLSQINLKKKYSTETEVLTFLSWTYVLKILRK